MGSGEDKLLPVIRSAEAAERQAGEELKRVTRVFEERSRTVETLRKRLTMLEKRRGDLQREALVAQRLGTWAKVAEHQTFTRRMGTEVTEVRNELTERERDLEQARSRTSLAEQEFLKFRVEKRKVENLLAQRVAEQRVRDSAREEAFLDDVNVTRGSRSKD